MRIMLGTLSGIIILASTWAEPSQESSVSSPPAMTAPRRDVKPFEYVEAKVPIYRGGGRTELATQMQKPLEPIESMKHFVHPQHVEVKLVVAEPDLGGKPIAFNWDERGRLWVAVSVDYPNNLQPQGRGHDRLVICEDIDKDGRVDRVHTFADKLSIPTSFLFAYDGVVVLAPPHTLFLRDKDGDDRADEWHILFSGWGTYDTHAGPSNLLYGLDNWIYGTVGYAGFQGRIAGEYHQFGQGLYRFKLERDSNRPDIPPQVTRFEFLRSTTNNTWGLGQSEDGEIFASTANGNPSVHLDIPNRYYEKVRGWSAGPLPMIAESARFYPITNKVRQVDFHGSFTAASGHLIYTARTYPRVYWNRVAFVADPTGHLVASLTLERQGSGYRSRYGWNLLASDDEWSAPIAAAVGPDGNVWVIDWYSYIVQHNPTPPGFRTGRGNAYETPLRDTHHGRIYKLVQRGSPLGKYPDLNRKKRDIDIWVAGLRHDNLFWRLHCQRLLVENRCLEVVPMLVKMLSDQARDECDLNTGVIHALWTLHGLGALEGNNSEVYQGILSALRHPAAPVRKNAILALPADARAAQWCADANIFGETDPCVQKALLLRLADMPASSWCGKYLAQHWAEDTWSQDRGLLHAYTIAAATHFPNWLSALKEAKRRNLEAAWRDIVERIGEHAARSNDRRNIRALLSHLENLEPAVQTALLAGWLRGTSQGQVAALDQAEEKQVDALLGRLPENASHLLVMVALRWKSESAGRYTQQLRAFLERDLTNDQLNSEARIRAAQQLAELFSDDRQVAELLLKQLTPQMPPEWIAGITSALTKMSRPDLVGEIVRIPGQLTPAGKKALLTQAFTRQDWLPELLNALGKGTISPNDLGLELRQSLIQHRDRRLAALARKILSAAGGLPNPDRQKVIESLVHLTKRSGDIEAGKRVFQTHCAKCHSYRGEGGKIGPDLTGMAVHSKEHLLVEILDPSRSVEGNYRQYLVATKSGLVLSGLLVAESRTTIELVDAEGKTHTLARDEIEELQASPKSLMPEGFEQQLSPEDLVNLLAFLTHREKYVPLPLERVATAVSTRGMFYREDAAQERLVFPDWKPKAYKGVPFHLVDPQGDRMPNVILLYSPQGTYPPKMPKAVEMPCNLAVRAVHLLSGVSGWGYPLGEKGSASLIVRLHYEDGQIEEHILRNGEHFADYIRRVDVPGSEFAFALRQQQIRYLAIYPKRPERIIRKLEFVKGPDQTAPIIMAVTLELSDIGD